MKKVISKSFWVDKDVEQLIGELLRYGVMIASIIVLLGGAIYLYQQGHLAVPSRHTFTGEGASYTTVKGIINGVRNFAAPDIIQLGVLALIATPILRIAFSLIAFVLEKDRLYVFITLIVLCVMLFSMFSGLKV
jgi:uncharacterized membrane protein